MAARRVAARNIEADPKRAILRRKLLALCRSDSMYPLLGSPGIAPPGPDFLEQARREGDETQIIPAAKLKKPAKKRRKKGDPIEDLPGQLPLFGELPAAGPETADVAQNIETPAARATTADQPLQPTDSPFPVVRAGERLIELMRQALRKPGFTMPVTVGHRRELVTFVPGHIWGEGLQGYAQDNMADVTPVNGPRKARVMVIGKMPGYNEVEAGRCFYGPTGTTLLEAIRRLHIPGSQDWYITNLLKFRPPDGKDTINAAWLRDCLPLLQQELHIVRPDYILCLGADSSKALLKSLTGDAKSGGVSAMEGRVMELKYPIHPEHTEDPDLQAWHNSLMMTVIHPAAVARDQAEMRRMERGLSRFDMLTRGIRFDKEERGIDHRVVRTVQELKDILWEIDNDPDKKDRFIGVDAEWHGEHPQNKGSYVRTIQFAWRPKHAFVIVWSDVEGKCAFFDDTDERPAQGSGPTCDVDNDISKRGRDGRAKAVEMLNVFLKNKRLVGHFLVADLEWLEAIGVSQALKSFVVPVHPKPFEKFTPKQQEFLARRGFVAGETVPAFFRTYFEGGWDTGYAAHAIEETRLLGLEFLVAHYTTAPRYDVVIQQWKEQYCKARGIKPKDLEGYGPIPDETLLGYACYDCDVTLRLYYEQRRLIDKDYEGNCCREPFWESMLTVPVILEMHQTGIPADRKRIDELTISFLEARANQESTIKTWSKWEEFNIRSVQHVKEFLFGERLNGKRNKDGSLFGCIRPPGAFSLMVEPILDTSKPPKQWYEIKQKGQEDRHNPSTAKTVLGALAQDNPDFSEQIKWIRDYRFLDQVLKSVLRPPKVDDQQQVLFEPIPDYDHVGSEAFSSIDPATNEERSATSAGTDNMMGMVYEAGLAASICDDGRVRSHMYPTTETGRWRSARPNLQNISKRRDSDYERMLGKERYAHKLRSILKALPGCVLLEADYKGAELFVTAMMCGDRQMLDHCRRNQLPEEGYDDQGRELKGGKFPHPDFYDIHSNIAVTAFNLHVPAGVVDEKTATKFKLAPGTTYAKALNSNVGDKLPATKRALSIIGKVSLRVAAKNVIFGLLYDRGAKAIALQCKEEGNPISVDDAQKIIDAIHRMYPGLVPFFDEAKRRAIEEGWLCHGFGRFRRFTYTDDRTLRGEFERQALNAPIQGMVASAMDRALATLKDYRDNELGQPELFKFALQIHDAVLLHVPYQNVDAAAVALELAMTDRTPIYPTDLTGVPNGTGPYRLGIDVEVFNHWGEHLNAEECTRFGIDKRWSR